LLSIMTSWSMEDIQVKQLVGKSFRRLRMRLHDVAIHELRSVMEYQLGKYGKEILFVNPAFTSMTCAKCGHVRRGLTLADRVFVCPNCGWTVDRDYNASLNILKHVGVGATLSACGAPPSTRSSRARWSNEAGTPSVRAG